MAGVVLSEAGYRKLKRELDQLRLQFKNLTNRLNRQGTQRRHAAKGMSIRIILGKTNSAHNKGNDGVVNIWDGPEGSEVATGHTINARNRMGNVGSGKWVLVVVFRGRAYLAAAECP